MSNVSLVLYATPLKISTSDLPFLISLGLIRYVQYIIIDCGLLSSIPSNRLHSKAPSTPPLPPLGCDKNSFQKRLSGFLYTHMEFLNVLFLERDLERQTAHMA